MFNYYLNKILYFLKRGAIQEDTKEKVFDFGLIDYYFRNKEHKSENQKIDDRTIEDIDFYEVFEYIDRTSSKVGQQYLLNKLLTLKADDDFEQQEIWIRYYLEHKECDIKSILSKLNVRESYYISNLFLDEYVKKPKWFWAIKILSITPVIFLLLFIFSSKYFLIVLIFNIIINLAIHYSYKNNLYVYRDSIMQLLVLHKCIKKIISFDLPISPDKSLLLSIKSIDKLKSKMSIFKLESRNDSDAGIVAFVFFEYIKIFFLLEPLTVFSVLSKLSEKRKDIQNLFEYCGMIDSFLSIATLRDEAPYCCKPVIEKGSKVLEFSNMYHPLIIDCVSNSMNTNGKSILLTGSNMAGKTTFIRTIAINVLLAQTINTCFAQDFKLSQMHLFSAIRISDDLLGDKSYYFEEVLAIKEMIIESDSLSNNLFVLDEIFKGTNTIERIAAGKAVLSYLAKSENNIVFVSTHDIELTELLHDTYDLYHFTEVIQSGKINFDYKLKRGNLSTRNAIRILEMNNYPRGIIEDAQKTSSLLQKNLTNEN